MRINPRDKEKNNVFDKKRFMAVHSYESCLSDVLRSSDFQTLDGEDSPAENQMNKICLVYLDDVIIFGKTFEDMFANLRKVFLCFG